MRRAAPDKITGYYTDHVDFQSLVPNVNCTDLQESNLDENQYKNKNSK